VDRFFKEKKMKCVVCKGSDIELKTVDEQIRTESDIILVQMNILVCSNCGERYYDRQSMRKIEEIRKKSKNKELDVQEVGKVMRACAA
jgi:YgiT-type zinc finger domain-containing protein